MRILIPRGIGFCFGVERALRMLDEALEKAHGTGKTVYSLGHIIHNEFVIENYRSRGVRFVDSLEELEKVLKPGDYVLIRSHGAPKGTFDKLNELKANIIDGTCPYVKNVHKIVWEASKENALIVILGHINHPEIVGTLSYADSEVYVVSDPSKLEEQIPLENLKERDVVVVSQTTEREERFEALVEKLSKVSDRLRVFNTICHVTKRNQTIARYMAKISELVLVVGGKNSSNTRKLFQLAKSKLDKVYHITYPDEVRLSWFDGIGVASVISGASTPKQLILEIADNLRRELEASVEFIDVPGMVAGKQLI